jgi:hypothetical protein
MTTALKHVSESRGRGIVTDNKKLRENDTMLRIPCCDVHYDFRIKTMYDLSLPPVVAGLLSYMFCYICVCLCTVVVQHMLCCLVFFFILYTLCCVALCFSSSKNTRQHNIGYTRQRKTQGNTT